MVVTCNFLDSTQKLGQDSVPSRWTVTIAMASQSSSRSLRRRWSRLVKALASIDREVLMSDLVGGQRLEVLGIEQHER